MSRSLPARPNLDHLKNQAKDRLRDLQARAPGSTLADALHAVAQEYEFKTWPELKAHVEAIAQTEASAPPPPTHGGGSDGGTAIGPPTDYGFSRYTAAAKRALFFARYEASELGSPSIEPEHVLLGVMRGAEGISSRLLSNAQVTLGDARAEVAARTTVLEKLPHTTVIPFSAETVRMLLSAAEEAGRMQHHDIDDTHLLLASLRQEGSVAASILEQKGLRLETMRRDYLELLKEEKP